MLFANVCAWFVGFCYGEAVLGLFFLFFLGFFLVFCAYGEYWSCWSPCYAQDLGYSGVPHAGHALWAEVGGGTTFATSREKTFKSMGPVPSFFWIYQGLLTRGPYMLALAGQPSLHGSNAYLVFYGLKGHLGEIAGRKMVRPLFLLFQFFCLVRNLGHGIGVQCFGICG